MKKLLFLSVILVFGLTSCKNNDDTPDDNGGDGGQPINATYRVTFTPNFSQANFPTDYPANAMFSGIVVAVHEPGKVVFRQGQVASDGLKTLAETGDSSDLINFLNSQGGTDSADFIVMSLAAAAGPTEAQSLNVTIDPDKTSISVVAALMPSPDWFIGVDGVSMIETSTTLVTDLSIGLSPLDAGTDSGDTYNAADDPTVPAAPIDVINGLPFSTGGPSPSIGTIRFERTDL